MSIEYIQETEPDGSIRLKSKTKQTSLFGKDDFRNFIKQLEKISIKPGKDAKKIKALGLFGGLEFKMYLWEGEYWMLRKDLEKLHPSIRDRFLTLTKEKVKEFDCFWLEEGIDFIEADRALFYQNFPPSFFPTVVKSGSPIILLSVEGILKTVSRSTKTKVFLFWLIKKFIKHRILKAQIESFWDKLQKTESPPELYYLTAVARQINIDKIEPQKWIGDFRGDLVIDDRFLVMIKGWKYHHGKYKRYSDTKRERYIQQEGYICIEFWAYEVFENVQDCVNETLEIINKFKNYERKNNHD